VTAVRATSSGDPPLSGSADIEVFQSILQLVALSVFILQPHNRTVKEFKSVFGSFVFCEKHSPLISAKSFIFIL
jgi:hypothetical protein